jgi:hypothetical protein
VPDFVGRQKNQGRNGARQRGDATCADVPSRVTPAFLHLDSLTWVFSGGGQGNTEEARVDAMLETCGIHYASVL